MKGTSGNLGQLVVQLTMDPATYRASLRTAENDTKAFSDAVDKSAQKAGQSMNSVGVHAAGARRELMVMAHEVVTGSWKNLAGSAMVFAEQIDLMSVALSPVGLAVGAVAATIGTFAVGIYKGAQEVSTFNKSIQLTGNYAGMTTSSIAAMSVAVADATHASVGSARQSVQALVSTGQIAGEALQVLGQSMIRQHELTGASLDDLAKDYARMPEGVAKWAEEHNRSMHFMTTAQYEHIRAIEETGDRQKAMLETAKLLDAHLRGESLSNLGALERAWRGVGSAIDGAWEWLKSIGKAETTAERVAAAKADLRHVEDAARSGTVAMRPGAMDAARARLAEAEKAAADEAAAAKKKSDDARTQEAGIAASDYLKRLRDEARGISRVNEALDDYKRKVADYNKANPENKVSAGQMAADMAEIRKKYADRSGASDANRIRKSLLDAALQETKNSLELIQNAHKNSDDQLQALHKATLISDHAFYSAQIALADDSAAKKIAAYEREKKTLQSAYWKAPADERIRLTKEIGEVDTKISKVREENASRDLVLLTQQEDAQRRYLKSISDTRDALLAQAGVSVPRAMHEYDDRNRGALLQAASTGDVQGAAFIEQNRQLTKLSAQYNDIIAQASCVQRKISLDQQEGLTGWIDGLSQLRANSADTVASLQALYDEVNRLSWQTTDEGVLRSLDVMRDRIRQSMLDSSNYLKEFTDAGRSAFSGLFQDIAAGTKTPAEAVRSMVISMLGSFAQLFANKAYTGLMGMLFDGALSSAGGMGGSAYGFTALSSIAGSGALFGVGAGMKFAGGGLISGPGTGTSDSILARVSNREFIVRADVVSQPGVLPLLEDLNNGRGLSRLASFARGGLVSRWRAAGGDYSDVGLNLSVSAPVYVQSSDEEQSTQSSTSAAQALADGLKQKMRALVLGETRPGGIIYSFVKNGR
ncbi:prophage tail length tape measure family protein [Burkholderia pseudomallei MSHR303]|nr:prophage tail length tape measure family protein [Burkholderia pseudomallei MSHR305]AHK66671.1 prophage tail length tape measure family protein [Burkholderia pseudomallei MSHR520]AIP78669.1 prophage tail length tape measure family protein [Burkholderia pseudomallei]KGW55674.1 prophage tail length tape measure family protein [Burkholderia pseudomallei MSHR303]